MTHWSVQHGQRRGDRPDLPAIPTLQRITPASPRYAAIRLPTTVGGPRRECAAVGEELPTHYGSRESLMPYRDIATAIYGSSRELAYRHSTNDSWWSPTRTQFGERDMSTARCLPTTVGKRDPPPRYGIRPGVRQERQLLQSTDGPGHGNASSPGIQHHPRGGQRMRRAETMDTLAEIHCPRHPSAQSIHRQIRSTVRTVSTTYTDQRHPHDLHTGVLGSGVMAYR